MPHVGLSVSADTKAQWENYVEESDHGSLSELIRTAVRKEIRRSGTDDSSVPRELEKELNRIAETQNQLQEQFSVLTEDFDDVVDAVGQQHYPDDVVDVAHEIATDLDEIHVDRFNNLAGDVNLEYGELAKEYFGSPDHAHKVGRAFDYLDENLSYVRKVPAGPSDYYRVRGR